jgi:hypothetical protein
MPDRTLTKTDTKLVLALACGATAEQAARQNGVHVRTVYRRHKDPAFRQEVQAVRTDMVQRAAATMTAAAQEAVKTLVLLQGASNPAPVRLGAARSVLEIGIKLREAADLEQRLAALEAHLLAEQAKP